jgi:MHS family proline/betaine transporter-like MFS transporter
MAAAGTVDYHDRRRARKAVVAASLGNVLEWYDIILFAFLSSTIASVFYPGGSLASKLMTWATFAITFVARPFGAVLIGNFADKHGRKSALTLTIGLMTLGMFILVILPGHATLGVGAAVILVIARIIQGLSAGGEFGSATAFMTENAEKSKAFYASWQVATQGVSMVMAAGVSWIFTSALSTDALQTWGWRVAFAIGLLIGPVGLYVRSRMADTPEFESAETDKFPVGTLLRRYSGRLITAFLSIAMATISVYLITYLPQFAVSNLHLAAWSAFPGAVVAGVVTLIGSPLVGKLADRVGVTSIMIPAAVAGIIVGWPLFALLTTNPSVGILTVCEIIVGILMCLYFAPLPALLSEIFHVQIRTSGMTIAYSFGVALFGGFAPFILTALVGATGSLTVPGMYYAAISLVSLVGVLLTRFAFRQR